MSTENPTQGSTVYYVLTVPGAEAVVGTGVLAYWKDCETPVEKAGTLSAGVFTAVFTPEETRLMLGLYQIEVKLKDTAGGDLGTVKQSSITIAKSAIPDWNG